MKYQKESNLISELVNLSQYFPNPTLHNDKEPFKSFGFGTSNISFVGLERVNKYQESIEQLFSIHKEISETYTLKKFETEIINLIRKLKSTNIDCKPDDFSKIIDELISVEIEESEILYNLYGTKMQSVSVQFGDFIIYNKEKASDTLFIKYPYLASKESFFDKLNSNQIIGVKVKARESSKAIEIADKLCQSFENVLSYAIADLSHQRRIGILNFRPWTTTTKITCYNDTMSYEGSNDIFSSVNLDDTFFKDPSQGNDKIWGLITKTNKNEIEERLLNTIEWIGKAINDKDMSKALVQFVFAIESMLQLNEKTIITPSIVSQLSDWLAFIIQTDKEERKKIAKYFKAIYQKRSAIAHGASKVIDIEDLQIALQIAKLMTISFLVTTPFKGFQTMEQLNAYMTDLKFQ